MASVTELGYIGLNVSNGEAWKEYAKDCVGMEVLDEGEGDRFYLRMDNWHHRFVLHCGSADDLAYMGWRVRDSRALAEIEALFTQAGIEYRVATVEEESPHCGPLDYARWTVTESAQ